MTLHDIINASRWWLILMILGGVATPLTHYLFRQLPDRGYAFTKMLGLLLVSYVFWLLGSLGFLTNELGSILFSLIIILLVSGWAYSRNQGELREWLFQNWRYLLIVEVVFFVVFFFWVWVRAQNPAIAATEKPMEFAFLNALGRTPTFPPHDPWLSNFAISYYYFGYVMTSVIARLAMVQEYIAFNLGVAWLAAGTSLGSLGIVYNLTCITKSDNASEPRRLCRTPIILALIAAIALPIAGNLEIALEILHANGYGSPSFWAWLDIRDLNTSSTGGGFGSTGPRFWWWWRASRVIHEYHLSGTPEPGLEPIAEFPSFSFILGDLHPHVLALPFTFLSLAVALKWWLQPISITEQHWKRNDWRSRCQLLVKEIGITTFILTILVLGGLSFLNTWDVFPHLFMILAAYGLSQWRTLGWHSHIFSQVLMIGVLLVIGTILFYLPFYFSFRSQASMPYLVPMLMRPTRLPHFLTIFGMPLWSITSLMVALSVKQRFVHWFAGLQAAVYLIGGLLLLMLFFGFIMVSSEEGAQQAARLANELSITLPARSEVGVDLEWGVTVIRSILPKVISTKLTYLGVTVFLTTLLSLTVMVWRGQFHNKEQDDNFIPNASSTGVPFILLLIATGSLLTIGPEFLYLRDFFGFRLNTVFKFYYQAWVIFGIASLCALDYLWRNFRVISILATTGYGCLLVTALLFPIYAIPSRAEEYRFPSSLDGIDYYLHQNPSEYEALIWLRENIKGTPVILEAVGGSYSPQGHGRVSASTGLPTVLGWPFHELQWRGTGEGWDERESDVMLIYTGNWETVTELLDHYNIELIYIGSLELSTYGQHIKEKFERNLHKAYENNEVTIYWWLPQ